jgi:hypothetical protein
MDHMNFDEFERDLLKRNKGRRLRQPRVSSWGLIFGIFVWAVIAIGAALVSGAHSVPAILQTIPVVVPSPIREILSLFGFTIFELLIFAGAVYRKGNRYAGGGLLLAFVGALAANLGSSIYAVTQNQGSGLEMVVAGILAIIAPSAAFLAGEMVHRLFVAHAEKLKEAFAEYDEARLKLDKWINAEFTKYMKQFEPSPVSRNDFMKSGEAETLHEPTRNAVKPRVKIHEVARLVHENGDADLSASDMMAKYNISLGSTSKIREMLKGQSGNEFIQ